MALSLSWEQLGSNQWASGFDQWPVMGERIRGMECKNQSHFFSDFEPAMAAHCSGRAWTSSAGNSRSMQLGANLLFPLLHQCPVQYPVSATYLAFIIPHPSRHLWGARFGGVGLPHALGRTNGACGSHISGLQIGPGQGPSVSCVTLHSTG